MNISRYSIIQTLVISSCLCLLTACGGGGSGGSERYSGGTESDRILLVAGSLESVDEDTQGQPAAGQSVTVFRDGNPAANTQTDDFGFFELTIPDAYQPNGQQGKLDITFGQDPRRKTIQPTADNVFLEVLYSESTATAEIIDSTGAVFSSNDEDVVNNFDPDEAIEGISNDSKQDTSPSGPRGDDDIPVVTADSKSEADELVETEGLI